MVTFKVGENFFLGDGQIYVKLLPSGESVQLTRGRQGKYGPVFTPDGSRVAYTQLDATRDGLSWDTFTVPVLGGEPTRLLPNASGLTFLANGRVLFAEIAVACTWASSPPANAAPNRATCTSRLISWGWRTLRRPHRMADGFSWWRWTTPTRLAGHAGFCPPTAERRATRLAPAARARPWLGLRTGSGCTSAPVSEDARISGASGIPTGHRSKSR
jgi:hypothetical protein